MAVKPQAVTLFCFLIILDYYFFNKKITLKILAAKLPYILISIIFFLVNVLAPGDNQISQFFFHSFEQSFFLFFYNLTFYIQKTFIPTYLSAIYPELYLSVKYTQLQYWIYPLIIFFLSFFIFIFRKNKLIIISAALYFFFILPVLHVITIGRFSTADRYSYFPCLGPILIFLYCLYKVLKFYKLNKSVFFITFLFFLTTVIILSIQTYKRSIIWQNLFSLWTDSIKKYPNNYLNYNALGNAYFSEKEFNQAIIYFKKALTINPLDFDSYNSLGLSYYNLRKYEDSISIYNSAEQIFKINKEIAYHRGLSLIELKDYDNAFLNFSAAINFDKKNYFLYYYCGFCMYNMNKFQHSLEFFNKALSILPFHHHSLIYRSKVYKQLQRYNEAIADLNIAEKYALPDQNFIFEERKEIENLIKKKLSDNNNNAALIIEN